MVDIESLQNLESIITIKTKSFLLLYDNSADSFSYKEKSQTKTQLVHDKLFRNGFVSIELPLKFFREKDVIRYLKNKENSSYQEYS